MTPHLHGPAALTAATIAATQRPLPPDVRSTDVLEREAVLESVAEDRKDRRLNPTDLDSEYFARKYAG